MESPISKSSVSDPSLENRINREHSTLKKLLLILGPGLITGASDDDPSGIATYAATGAAFGYGMLWMALFTFPMMAAVQYICAKIGLVSGRGVASLIRDTYSKPVLYSVVILLAVANAINAGVDIGAVAAGLNLLVGIPIWLLCIPVAVGLTVFQIFGSYDTIVRYFKWLTLALFAYIGSSFLARPEWHAVLFHTFVPHIQLDAEFLAMLVAILGTTISPYLFFWQANHEIEEEKARGRKKLWQRQGATDGELRYAAMDVNCGMFLSNLVMYFIILATAATLHKSGQTRVDSAADAAKALRPIAGAAAELLMAVGLVGSGLLAIPVLTASSAYAVSEAFGWKTGLDKKPKRAKHFYAVIAISTLIGLLINFFGLNPIQALVWTSILNGFLAPPLLIVIMLIANNKAIMKSRVNGRMLNFIGWLTTLILFVALVGMILTWKS